MQKHLAWTVMIGFLVAASVSFAQTRSRPALIRDTSVAEGKTEEESKEKKFNPLEAQKNVKVGDFYYKRKNYGAAIRRYQEALEYQPNYIKAFERLGKTYEKSGEKQKAIDLYKQFIDKYPGSPKASDFKNRIVRLEQD